MSSPPDIPVEIFDYILGFVNELSDKDEETMRSCYSVCRSWSALACQYVFSHIMIKPGGDCLRFCELLDANPAISKCAKEIAFCDQEVELDKPNDVPWVLQATDLLVGKLPNITAIDLMGLHETGEIASPELFFNLSTFTKVTRLEMLGCLMPSKLLFAYISSFPALEYLHLSGILVPIENLFNLDLTYIHQCSSSFLWMKEIENFVFGSSKTSSTFFRSSAILLNLPL